MIKEKLIKEFLIESCEAIGSISEEFTRYETHPEDQELLNSIYRKIHTVKGSASFLNFVNLQAITHSAESILDYLRDGTIKVHGDLIDLMLSVVDSCSEILTEVEKSGTEGNKDYAQIKSKLLGFIEKSLIDGGGMVVVFQ